MSNIEGITIYAIKTMTRCQEDAKYPGYLDFGHERNVGYYTDLGDAINCVSNNDGDIWETIYTFAMIEEIQEGLYGSAGSHTWWFKWNNMNQQYESMDMPDLAANKFGFIMG